MNLNSSNNLDLRSLISKNKIYSKLVTTLSLFVLISILTTFFGSNFANAQVKSEIKNTGLRNVGLSKASNNSASSKSSEQSANILSGPSSYQASDPSGKARNPKLKDMLATPLKIYPTTSYISDPEKKLTPPNFNVKPDNEKIELTVGSKYCKATPTNIVPVLPGSCTFRIVATKAGYNTYYSNSVTVTFEDYPKPTAQNADTFKYPPHTYPIVATGCPGVSDKDFIPTFRNVCPPPIVTQGFVQPLAIYDGVAGCAIVPPNTWTPDYVDAKNKSKLGYINLALRVVLTQGNFMGAQASSSYVYNKLMLKSAAFANHQMAYYGPTKYYYHFEYRSFPVVGSVNETLNLLELKPETLTVLPKFGLDFNLYSVQKYYRVDLGNNFNSLKVPAYLASWDGGKTLKQGVYGFGKIGKCFKANSKGIATKADTGNLKTYRAYVSDKDPMGAIVRKNTYKNSAYP